MMTDTHPAKPILCLVKFIILATILCSRTVSCEEDDCEFRERRNFEYIGYSPLGIDWDAGGLGVFIQGDCFNMRVRSENPNECAELSDLDCCIFFGSNDPIFKLIETGPEYDPDLNRLIYDTDLHLNEPATSFAIGGRDMLIYKDEGQILYYWNPNLSFSVTVPGEPVTAFDISDQGHIWIAVGQRIKRATYIPIQDEYRPTDPLSEIFDWQFVSNYYYARQLSISDTGVWMLSLHFDVYYRADTYANQDTPGSVWMHVPFKMKSIATGRNIVVGITLDDEIFYRAGIDSSTPYGIIWIKALVQGVFTKISIKDDILYLENFREDYEEYELYSIPIAELTVDVRCWNYRSRTYFKELRNAAPTENGCPFRDSYEPSEDLPTHPGHQDYGYGCSGFSPYPIDILIGLQFPPANVQDDDALQWHEYSRFLNPDTELITTTGPSAFSFTHREDTRHLLFEF